MDPIKDIHSITLYLRAYCSLDLEECGAQRYAESSDFTPLLLLYSINDEQYIHTVDFTQGEAVPEELLEVLTDPDTLKWAYDADRERPLLAAATGHRLSPLGWRSTTVLAAAHGLPAEPATLMPFLMGQRCPVEETERATFAHFELPQPMPGRSGAIIRRILPKDDPAAWTTYHRTHCSRFALHSLLTRQLRATYGDDDPQLWQDYDLDQRINDRGILLDYTFADQAAQAVLTRRAQVHKELDGLCLGHSQSLVADALLAPNMDEATKECIRSLRQEDRMTSVSKYETMLECECADGRLHGMFRFYGARTGRWTSRLVQLQNMPRMTLPCLDEARRLIREGDLHEAAQLTQEATPMEVLSQLVRTALIPSPGCRFIICDFAAVEARVLAWLVEEEWVLDVLRTTGRLYEATAAQLYGVSEAEITHDDPRRAHGKVATLALGYGGGMQALARMGGTALGLTEPEMIAIVKAWRQSRPKTTAFWDDLAHAFMGCLYRQDPLFGGQEGGQTLGRLRLTLQRGTGALVIALPSGRRLYYPKAHAARTGTHYGPAYYAKGSAPDSVTRTNGATLTENVVQAIARDLLADVLRRLAGMGLRVVAHVHDEVIIEAPEASADRMMEETQAVFRTPPAWATGLPLDCSAFLSDYYQK